MYKISRSTLLYYDSIGLSNRRKEQEQIIDCILIVIHCGLRGYKISERPEYHWKKLNIYSNMMRLATIKFLWTDLTKSIMKLKN